MEFLERYWNKTSGIRWKVKLLGAGNVTQQNLLEKKELKTVWMVEFIQMSLWM